MALGSALAEALREKDKLKFSEVHEVAAPFRLCRVQTCRVGSGWGWWRGESCVCGEAEAVVGRKCDGLQMLLARLLI